MLGALPTLGPQKAERKRNKGSGCGLPGPELADRASDQKIPGTGAVKRIDAYIDLIYRALYRALGLGCRVWSHV